MPNSDEERAAEEEPERECLWPQTWELAQQQLRRDRGEDAEGDHDEAGDAKLAEGCRASIGGGGVPLPAKNPQDAGGDHQNEQTSLKANAGARSRTRAARNCQAGSADGGPSIASNATTLPLSATGMFARAALNERRVALTVQPASAMPDGVSSVAPSDSVSATSRVFEIVGAARQRRPGQPPLRARDLENPGRAVAQAHALRGATIFVERPLHLEQRPGSHGDLIRRREATGAVNRRADERHRIGVRADSTRRVSEEIPAEGRTLSVSVTSNEPSGWSTSATSTRRTPAGSTGAVGAADGGDDAADRDESHQASPIAARRIGRR